MSIQYECYKGLLFEDHLGYVGVSFKQLDQFKRERHAIAVEQDVLDKEKYRFYKGILSRRTRPGLPGAPEYTAYVLVDEKTGDEIDLNSLSARIFINTKENIRKNKEMIPR